MQFRAFLISALPLLAACGANSTPSSVPVPPKQAASADAPAKAKATLRKVGLGDVGLSAKALDRTVDPCDNFYKFACGGWEKATAIPGDQPRWNRSFSEIHKRNQADLKGILQSSINKKAQTPVSMKIGAFYSSCMDERTIEKAGLSGMKGTLDKVSRLASTKSLPKLLAELHGMRVGAFFSAYAGPDDKDARMNLLQVDQAGLGLPDRDYYLKDDDKSKKIRAFYVGHIERMLVFSGVSKFLAASQAKSIVELETRLAKASKSRVERRDPDGMYNKLAMADFKALATSFDWVSYFKARKLDVASMNVTSPAFVKSLASILQGIKLPVLRSYLRWHLMHKYAPTLTKAIVDENFALTKTVTGQPVQKPRWKRCVSATDALLGELLAQAYVEKRFSGESKKAVQMMVQAIGAAFEANLSKLSWMDDKTRARAKEKMTGMEYLVGYPDKWKSYDFDVKGGDYLGNTLRAVTFDTARRLAKAGKPVDRSEWFMTPPTVNAYYHPNFNHMVYPAGILQPPFFSPKASLPVNMGGMGMVVGHEITHGFDDQGSKFDVNGNLKSWWAPSVRSKFEKRTACVDKQYSSYEVLPGVKLNGKLTLGENIADIGGVKLAFAAYRQLRKDAKELLVADGFSEDQQFFLSIGQIWCSKYREDFARMRAKTDSHSQPNWRVNGSLANTPEFAEAFQCKAGSKMRPQNACMVW